MIILNDIGGTCPECKCHVWIDDNDVVWRTVEDQRIGQQWEATVDRISGVIPTVTCPHCGHLNSVPEDLPVRYCSACELPIKLLEHKHVH
jgi:hypothetical protein